MIIPNYLKDVIEKFSPDNIEKREALFSAIEVYVFTRIARDSVWGVVA